MQFSIEIQYDYIKVLSRNPLKSSERCRCLYRNYIIYTDGQSRWRLGNRNRIIIIINVLIELSYYAKYRVLFSSLFQLLRYTRSDRDVLTPRIHFCSLYAISIILCCVMSCHDLNYDVFTFPFFYSYICVYTKHDFLLFTITAIQ